jgi:hypothetical protein
LNQHHAREGAREEQSNGNGSHAKGVVPNV